MLTKFLNDHKEIIFKSNKADVQYNKIIAIYNKNVI